MPLSSVVSQITEAFYTFKGNIVLINYNSMPFCFVYIHVFVFCCCLCRWYVPISWKRRTGRIQSIRDRRAYSSINHHLLLLHVIIIIIVYLIEWNYNDLIKILIWPLWYPSSELPEPSRAELVSEFLHVFFLYFFKFRHMSWRLLILN